MRCLSLSFVDSKVFFTNIHGKKFFTDTSGRRLRKVSRTSSTSPSPVVIKGKLQIFASISISSHFVSFSYAFVILSWKRLRSLLFHCDLLYFFSSSSSLLLLSFSFFSLLFSFHPLLFSFLSLKFRSGFFHLYFLVSVGHAPQSNAIFCG